MSKPPEQAIADPSLESSPNVPQSQREPGLAVKEPGPSPAEEPSAAGTVQIDRTLSFSGLNGEAVELGPGAYVVQARAHGELVLTPVGGQRGHSLAASAAWHDLGLTGPLALSVPGEDDDRHVVMLLPGGAALLATGRSGPPGAATRSHDLKPASLVDAVLKWLPPSLVSKLPFDKAVLLNRWASIWGSIEPGPSPTGLGPSYIPPYWVSATVATCHPAPAGSYGPGGPGTETGVPPFPPGSAIRRGAFPSYIQSVTPVTITSSVSMVGRVVQVHVTSHVVNIGPSILSMTWRDVYQIVPAASGAVTFPAVIVATGRVPTAAPPSNTTWAAEVQKRLTSPTGRGAPTEFELWLEGICVRSRTCEYLGRFPLSPELRCH